MMQEFKAEPRPKPWGLWLQGSAVALAMLFAIYVIVQMTESPTGLPSSDDVSFKRARAMENTARWVNKQPLGEQPSHVSCETYATDRLVCDIRMGEFGRLRYVVCPVARGRECWVP